jgi:putative ABC transport system permease protein
MDAVIQDVRFAVRQLMRAPSFALVAIATLALAIGASTAVFSVLDATVVRPLPYDQPEKIVRLQTYAPEGYGQPASWLQYLDWRRENKTLAAMGGFEAESANLESPTGAAPVRVVYGTDGFFDVFGVKPLMGRTFAQGEDQPGHNDVIVLSYELWQQSFGGRKDVVGSAVKLDGVVNTVIGVMPAGFRYPLSVNGALYQPFHLPQTRSTNRGQHFLPMVGRLKPGVTVEQAQADMQHVFDNLGRAYPDEVGRKVKMQMLADATLGKTAEPLRVLTMAVFGVLLVGCVNVAGLLLARGVKRQKEFGLRAAVGAGRERLVRQLLTESALLSLAGAGAGGLLAAALLQGMRQLLVHSLARGADVRLNLTVLGASVAMALVTGICAGLLPALQSARIAPASALRASGNAGTSRGQSRLRGWLIAVQIAVALGLLVCSGLLVRNLQTLRNTELGFQPDHVLTADIFLTPANYTGRNLLTSFHEPLLERVRGIPGVTNAGLINMLPIADYGNNSDISIVGQPPPPPHQERLAENRIVTPGVIEAIGGRLVKGRMLSVSLDREDAPLAATVNEAFVRKFFANDDDPLTHQIQWGDMKVNLVGVTSDMRQDLGQATLAEMDISAAQVPAKYAVESLTRLSLVVRSTVPPEDLIAPLRQALHETDASVPFRVPLTMREVIAETLTFERLESWLFGIFAGLALTLSLVGIYGMVQHEVELQTRDIGVRMALGATRARVVMQILRRVSLLMLGGIVLGWALTLGLQRALAAVVTIHAAKDGALMAALTLMLALIGVAASLVPARRAATIDPMQALRNE